MRILGILLDGIQTYTEPTLIPLSQDKTLIKGGNDKGKSVIKKALGIFADVYNKDDYRSLINYKKEQATVTLFLSNRTVLIAYVNTKSVIYRLCTWQMDICLKEWNEYSSEISRYLGWVTVPGEELCINLAESSVNVLVNTSRSANTQIIKSISTIPEVDLKMENLRNALEIAKANNKWADVELKVQKTYCTFNIEKYNAILSGKEALTSCENIIENLELLTRMLYNAVDIRTNRLQLLSTENKKQYIVSIIASKYIKLSKSKKAIEHIKHHTQIIIEMNNIVKLMKERNRISGNKILIMSKKNEVKFLEQSRCIISELKTLYIKNLQTQAYKKYHNIIILRYLTDLVRCNKSHYQLCKIMNTNNSLKVTCNAVITLKKLTKVFLDYINNQAEMDKFDVCPLCHQRIETHHNHQLNSEVIL